LSDDSNRTGAIIEAVRSILTGQPLPSVGATLAEQRAYIFDTPETQEPPSA